MMGGPFSGGPCAERTVKSLQQEVVEEFHRALENLKMALECAPRAQIGLLEAVDRLYAALETTPDALGDAELLDAQVTLRHAESILTRYFGM